VMCCHGDGSGDTPGVAACSCSAFLRPDALHPCYETMDCTQSTAFYFLGVLTIETTAAWVSGVSEPQR
jgi:hypothetical protein